MCTQQFEFLIYKYIYFTIIHLDKNATSQLKTFDELISDNPADKNWSNNSKNY